MTPDPTPLLHSARLTLEPLRPDHAPLMLAGLSDPELYRYLSDRPPADADEIEARSMRILAGPDGADRWCNWIVRRSVDARCLGTVQATIAGAGEEAGRGLVGIMIFQRFWRRGIGREALAVVLDWLFGSGRCHAADALVDTRNAASRALFEGLGFQRVGRIQDADFFDGQPSHEDELALDRAAWRSRAAR